MLIGEILNKTFGHVYVKNLPDSTERRKFVEDSLKKNKVQYTIVPACNGLNFCTSNFSIQHGPFNLTYPSSAGFLGFQLSDIKMLIDEIDRKSDSCLCLTDDVFIRNVSALSEESVRTIPEKIPSDWDMIIMGGLVLDGPLTNTTQFTYNRATTSHQIAGASAIAINKNIYIEYLARLMKFDYYADGLLDKMAQDGIKIYTLNPGLMFQNRSMKSDVNKCFTNDYIIDTRS